MGCHYCWFWPPVYLHFAKFCIFSRKLHDIFCIVCTFMLHIQNKTHGRGPLINSHSNRHLTPPLHLQPWKYMSTREYIFLSHAPCEHRYKKEKFVRRKIYSLALLILKISINPWCDIPIEIVIIHGIEHS